MAEPPHSFLQGRGRKGHGPCRTTTANLCAFASLVRVSTERQEKRGESLRTQTSQITGAVKSLNGNLVKTYSGQEHATAGHERKILEQLFTDVAKSPRPFDAVMVADPTRWSRDNVASETGLETLRDAGVKFFVLTSEYDLFNPDHRLFLGLSSTIGAFHARKQKQKSLENRIERAKRGIPTGGKVPFGRKWENEQWVIDPKQQEIIADIAARYLKGEQLPKLAKKYHMNHSNVCKVLRERCGEDWEITFQADDLNIKETVSVRVPPLLDEKTIKAVRHRLEANRTYLHGKPKHEWLLGGRVFCAQCGYVMFGQVNHQGHRYYRHAHTPRDRECPLRPRPWVRADKIEGAVVSQLFRMFGNPAAIERAVKVAIPDCDKTRSCCHRLEEDIAKIERTRDRVLSMIEKDVIDDRQAEKKLRELKEREDAHRDELDKLKESLVDIPDEESIRCYVEACTTSRQEIETGQMVEDLIFLFDDDGKEMDGGNHLSTLLTMSREDKRNLILAVFDKPLPNGQPAGVYVSAARPSTPHRPKEWTFKIRGNLDFECVTQCSSRLPDKAPPEFRSCAALPPPAP